jgi:anaerobic ribonucleoside-triphosphate reductase activating protein
MSSSRLLECPISGLFLWQLQLLVEIISMLKRNPLIDGVTLSGGEPFEQPDALADLCDDVHKLGYNIMAWSGYTFEQLAADKGKRKLLERIDVLIDGELKEELKSLNLLWRGSQNQRIIDVKNSIRENLIVELNA